MGKRGNISHKKDDRNSNDVQQNPRCSQPTIAVEDKLKFSPVVTIDYSCWSSAEKALLKNCVVRSPQINSQSLSSTTLRSRASPRKQSRTARGGGSPVTLKQNSESIPKANSKPVRKILRRSPRKIIKALNLQQEVSRRRKASQRRVNRALGSVRKPRKPLDLSCPVRKSSRIKSSKIIIKRGKVTLRTKTLKMDSHSKEGDSNESPTSSETDQQTKGVASKADVNTEDSDNDIEMQVLEKQVSSDKEDEDDTNEDVSMNLPDDTDEESSLLSPSALPASSVFRSPSRRKLSARKQEQNAYTYNPSFRETPEPSTSSSVFHSSLSPSRRSEKRGRGRPRKPLEDVKSVSGKLYRKKLAERLADASINRTSVNIPRASASVQSTSASPHVLTQDFEDALEDEEDQGDQDEDHGDTSRKKLNRWNNRSTFVYAKHKFVSNENKFKCDTCQVSFTALSSLKRHYGTIYHKQQEAAGGPSTLDLSDILRPDRNNAMGSSPSNDSSAAGPSSRFTNGRGRPPQYANVARTSSFVRRNAVDNIKKYYAAADAARRKRENGTNSAAPSAFTSWFQSKQQRRRRNRFNSEVYSSADSDTNDFFERGDHPFDLDEDVENSFPIGSFPGQIPESKKWLSNSWKGVGPPHFTCEVCGEEYARKLDFTAHLFAHRQQEQVDEELTCSDCDTQFPSEASLDQHNKLLHHASSSNGLQNQAKKFVCRKCSSVFPRPEYLQKHMLTHKRPRLRCPHCPKQFEFKFYLYDHIKAEHEALNILANSHITKPKMELLNASSSTSLPENRNRSRHMGSEDIFRTDQNRRMMMVTHRRTKPVTSNANVQEYLAAHNENELKKGEGNRIHSTEMPSRHCIATPEHQPESVNIMQKFFDSQNSQKQSFSTATDHAGMDVENEAVGMGQVDENDGNIVIQFGPMKHSVFDDSLDRPDTEGDGDTCLSPLTIEIPRHVDGDKKDSETLQDANNANGKMTYVSGGKSRVIISTLQGPLLGCGVTYILPTKPLENALTCQDCGKTFEHRKSLVKHVQYYRQSEEYSCTICNKTFRLKHHVSRHMKSFHNIDTNSTTSSTSGDNADIHGDIDDPCEIDPMNSPSGSSSGGLLASMGHSEVSGVSGTSFTRQFTSGDDTRKRNLSSVKSALSKIRSMSWKNMKKVEDPGDQSKKRLLHLGPSSTDKSNRMTKKFTKSKPSSVSSESSSASASGSGSTPDFNYEDNYTMVLDSNGAQAFKCLLCKKLYPSKHRLNSHLWYHKKASVFKCNVCNAEFKFKHDLNAHHQIHNVHRVRFKCEICPNKSFSWRKDLLKHLRTKHYVGGTPTESSSMEDKLSRCPFCPLVFPEDEILTNHISEQHTKCVVCQECGQVVGSSELLSQHMEQEHEGGESPTPSPHASPVQFQQHEDKLSDDDFELLELN